MTLSKDANFPVFAENTKTDLSEVKDKLQINQQKQSKLTDAYLENLLGADVYRDKITDLRKEEDELKKLLAGYELREIERERSEGYINRVKDFLDGYDDSKEKIDFATKKEMCGLLFKNIPHQIYFVNLSDGDSARFRSLRKIADKKIFSFEFFVPFNFFYLQEEQKTKCHQNPKTIRKVLSQQSGSISGLSAVR